MDGWLNAESEHYEIITPQEFSHACLSQKMAASLKLPRSVLQKVQDKQHFAILLHKLRSLDYEYEMLCMPQHIKPVSQRPAEVGGGCICCHSYPRIYSLLRRCLDNGDLDTRC